MVASVRFTALPRLALVPATGVWRSTVPGGKLQFPLRVTVPVVSPALVRVPRGLAVVQAGRGGRAA
jgi:hypothetical protein